MNTTKPELNVKLLRRIKRHILAEPKRFLMSCSVIRADSRKQWKSLYMHTEDASKIMPPCGTAACIAGWADLLTGGNADGSDSELIQRAATALGVEASYIWMGHTLFSRQDWPEPFASSYSKARRPSRRARIAADRIEHLIKTGQ